MKRPFHISHSHFTTSSFSWYLRLICRYNSHETNLAPSRPTPAETVDVDFRPWLFLEILVIGIHPHPTFCASLHLKTTNIYSGTASPTHDLQTVRQAIIDYNSIDTTISHLANRSASQLVILWFQIRGGAAAAKPLSACLALSSSSDQHPVSTSAVPLTAVSYTQGRCQLLCEKTLNTNNINNNINTWYT